MNAPKVFLSHASEDKDRFVNNFALRLREKGIDAWLDKWEMLPGDSLVDKIFEEGLKEADAVIIVLSSSSVEKPWVKEELNSSVVARIERGTRLIPVVIDDCCVPEALKTTLWESITDLANYDENFDRIVASIFGRTLKPELGKPPAYTSTVLTGVGNLDSIDNLVLKTSCDFLLEHPDQPIEPGELFGSGNSQAPPKSEVLDSIAVLADAGYLDVSRYWGGGSENWGCHYRVTAFGFEEYCQAYLEGYGQLVERLAGLIVNKEANTNLKLRELTAVPLMVANHVIRLLERNGHVKVSAEMGEGIYIYEVSAKLRRALR